MKLHCRRCRERVQCFEIAKVEGGEGGVGALTEMSKA